MPTKKNNKTKFTKINNILDKEHADIFTAIDKLYTLCEKHWRTEENMYRYGLKKIPKHHDNVTQLWKAHANEHIKLLNQIKKMKKEIVKHIEEKDAEHFHWSGRYIHP